MYIIPFPPPPWGGKKSKVTKEGKGRGREGGEGEGKEKGREGKKKGRRREG